MVDICSRQQGCWTTRTSAVESQHQRDAVVARASGAMLISLKSHKIVEVDLKMCKTLGQNFHDLGHEANRTDTKKGSFKV